MCVFQGTRKKYGSKNCQLKLYFKYNVFICFVIVRNTLNIFYIHTLNIIVNTLMIEKINNIQIINL